MIERNKLSLEEKIKLLSGKSGEAVAEKYGCRFPSMSDGPHGITRHGVCYPNMCLSACSWNEELLSAMGRSIANDCIEEGVDVLLGPSVNVKRNPLCGRNFEYFSEDVYLSGILGAAFINGVQSTGVSACVKHFCCYNQETNRFTQSVFVDDDVIMDVYARVFKIITEKSEPDFLMTAYNAVNGELVSESKHLIQDVLRGVLGYKGAIISDWGGVDYRSASLEAGVNINMPGDEDTSWREVLSDVENGFISEKTLNDAADKVIEALKKINAPKKAAKTDKKDILELTEEGMVLLKNDGEALPFSTEADFAVIGSLSKNPIIQGGGCAEIKDVSLKTPFEALCDRTGRKPVYAAGYSMLNDEINPALEEEAVSAAEKADTVLFFAGLLPWNESEGYDRKSMKLPENQIALLKKLKSKGKKIVTVLTNGAAVELGEVAECSAAILECWYAGDFYARALCNMLFGEVNPSGRLAESFPYSLSDYIPASNYVDGEGCVRYGEGRNVGYKYYLSQGNVPLYPFGYGLSYTRFDYSEIKLGSGKKDSVNVTLTVKNMGTRAGKETVQIYLRRPDENYRSLCGFKKIFLNAGESAEVTVNVERDCFCRYNVKNRRYELFGGEYIIEACKNAETPVAAATWKVMPEFKCTRYTRIDELRKIGNGPELIAKYFSECIGRAVVGVNGYKLKFKGREIDDVPFVRNVAYSLPLYVFTTLTAGKLSNSDLTEIIDNINEELI